MKVRLVEPPPPGVTLFARSALPRLGLPLAAAALAADGHDVRVYAPVLAPLDDGDLADADLVGISTTTATAPAAYALADRLRARGVPVVLGGPHVTFLPGEGLAHADFVARGEGGLESVAGLSFRRGDGTVHNPDRPRRTDLDTLPLPALGLVVGHERLRTAPVLTSLGCPFDCTFCSVTALFGRRYRFRSTESVLEELRRRPQPEVFFYDDNLAADRARLKELLAAILSERLARPWMAQVRVDVARDPELLDLMRRSGCRLVFVGLESVRQETLDGYGKRQTPDDIALAVERLHRHGILVHGMFVLGADSDTVETVAETVDFAFRVGIDTIMLSGLTPLPGTAVHRDLEAQGRIFDRDWSHYDSHHMVFHPRHAPASAFQEEGVRQYRRFYALRRTPGLLLRRRWRTAVLHRWGRGILQAWLAEQERRGYLAWLHGFDAEWQALHGSAAAARH